MKKKAAIFMITGSVIWIVLQLIQLINTIISWSSYDYLPYEKSSMYLSISMAILQLLIPIFFLIASILTLKKS